MSTKNMKFDLSIEKEKEQAIEFFQDMLQNDYILEMNRKHNKRSIPQNAYLHVLLKYCALNMGETYHYFKEFIMKRVIAPDIFSSKYTNPVTNEEREDWKSSADLDSKELTIVVERMKTWASRELQIELPEPGNYNAIRNVQNELEINTNWL